MDPWQRNLVIGAVVFALGFTAYQLFTLSSTVAALSRANKTEKYTIAEDLREAAEPMKSGSAEGGDVGSATEEEVESEEEAGEEEEVVTTLEDYFGEDGEGEE